MIQTCHFILTYNLNECEEKKLNIHKRMNLTIDKYLYKRICTKFKGKTKS